MKTLAIRLTSRTLMIFAVVVMATGALLAGVASFLGSFDNTPD
jgi:hypothetical protein